MRTSRRSRQGDWMVGDGIYEFYGEQEEFERTGVWVEDPNYPGTGLMKGWDTYIWLNLHDQHWGGHEGMTGGTDTTYNEQRGRFLRGDDYGTEFAKTNMHLAQMRAPFFNVDDPVTYLGDFHKMDWGRPKGVDGSSARAIKAVPDSFAGANDSPNPTIATRVQRRVYPILYDYFMGEAYHAVPATSGTPHGTYHNAAKEAYTPVHPGFKPMDWRGLIDTPEDME
jgi:hypothetical protein